MAENIFLQELDNSGRERTTRNLASWLRISRDLLSDSAQVLAACVVPDRLDAPWYGDDTTPSTPPTQESAQQFAERMAFEQLLADNNI